MKFITYKRFHQTAICGNVNLPSGTVVDCDLSDNTIKYKGQPLCKLFSENAHLYFSRNDDGRGMERGALVRRIMNRLRKHDKLHQERWDKIWEDSLCQRFKRKDHPDFWVWNESFYNAEICDLQYIAKLIGA